MVRFFRLRRVQRWPEDWIRNVQVIVSQVLNTAMKLNVFWKNSWMGFLLLAMLGPGGCAGTPHSHQEGPLPPPEHATPLAAQLILEGNQRFAEHRWTAAMGKYEEAIHAQPKLAEAHYNLGVTLYRKGPVSAARPHFIEAANLAPGHPVIRNAPPVRKFGTVDPKTENESPDEHYYQH